MRRGHLLASALLLVACGGSEPPRDLSLRELPDIDASALLQHIKVLSSDDFEGRAPGGRGEQLTVGYLVDQFKTLGLEPGNTDGTFIQKVPLVGITTDGAPLMLARGSQRTSLAWKDDVVAWTKQVAESASIRDSEMVFVGYGVVAPEYQWDDFKGVDVKGKTLVMLVNDPPVPDPANPSQLDPTHFGGRGMTYYGRWTYKFDKASELGAAGVFLIHETGPAGYPFDVVQGTWTGEQFDLNSPDGNLSRVPIQGWITNDAARALLKMAGHDFDALKTQAVSRDFKPVPLGVAASMTLNNRLRRLDSQNVVAKLTGREGGRKDQYVVYTAHWDHLGNGPAVDGDSIYNGAVDNASGVAGTLEIARALTKLTQRPARTVLFLMVTAEEQGLLGSAYYAAQPIYPLERTAAVINLDGLNVHGRTRDLTLIGLGASDLDEYVRDAAGEQGRTIRPDPEPEKGFYYRSDHFNFAKSGVPALDPDEGVDFVGKPPGFGEKARAEYTARHYHKPSDVVRAEWDLSGAAQDLKVLLAVGYRVAEADRFPEWTPGNEFKARRDAMMATRR